MQPGRVQYLEGLRGVAAVQVMLLHVVTGFLPCIADHAAPPLRVLWDGHTAVYVFFLISGAVLTPSFARGGPWPWQVAKRVVRLGIPVAVAAILALALLAALPQAHRQAALVSGSAWLASDSSGAPTLTHLLHEVAFDSLLLGYREYTLFVPFADDRPLLAQSLDAPFWSLHLELYGSLLVLGLVVLRQRSWPLHAAAVVLCAVLFGAHPMFLFVLGHLCAPRLGRTPVAGVGGALVLLGLAMSARKDWLWVDAMRHAASLLVVAPVPNLFQFQSQVAAVALFGGALLSPTAQRLLASGVCRHLGRLSFSLYLLHFPILFTVCSAALPPLARALPYPAAIGLSFGLFAAAVLAAAVGFERWVDRPAMAASRAFGRRAAAA